MDSNEKKLIYRLLSSIDSLSEKLEMILENHHKSTPYESTLPEWINAAQAQKILQRGRTWLNSRMLETVTQPINTNWFLIKGLDYTYEGNRLIFKTSSVQRLKAEMRRMGAKEAA
jgi:hypothetical protein